MNTLKMIISSTCLLLNLSLSAQNKELDPDLPYLNKIEVNEQALESIFLATGQISLELAPGFKLEGIIQNKSRHGNSVISLLVKLQSRPGGTLNLTQNKDSNGHVMYSGQLVKLHEPEGMVLVERERHYYFIETQQRFLVTE